MSLRFEHPQAILALLGVALLLLVMLRNRRYPGVFSWRHWILVALGMSACVLGISRPQWGQFTTTQTGLQGNLYLAVDVSTSMNAQDVAPSRIEYAAAFLRKLLPALPGVRIAIYPFAADGYLLMPLTADADAAVDMLDYLSPDLTTQQGTDFDTSLGTLYKIIHQSRVAHPSEAQASRVLLLSDGETHAKISNRRLEHFREDGIAIDTVGIGTSQGGTIPVRNQHGFGNENLRDQAGNPVRTKLDLKPLEQIAQGTGGELYPADFTRIPALGARIEQGMEYGKLSTRFELDAELYPWCFLVALVVLSAEFLFGGWHFWIKALALFAFCGPTWAEEKPRPDPYTAYNRGIEENTRGNAPGAIELFAEAAANAKDARLRKQALYNLGNALLQSGDATQALSAYQRARDTEAPRKSVNQDINQRISDNMVLAQKVKQQQEEEQKGRRGEGDDDGKKQAASDPGRAQDFKSQQFDEEQKKKMFDIVSSEEREAARRLHQDSQNGKAQSSPVAQPW